MVSKIKFFILIILILFISGCIDNDVNITELVKQSQQGQEFLNNYPEAEISAVSLSSETIASMIDEIRQDCHPTIPVKAYWYVKFTDSDTNAKLNMWIDKETQEVICIIKKANANKTEANNQTQEIPENNSTPLPEVRKNCRELNGFLCSESNDCAVDWLDSFDSYCCPIECNVCTEKITDNCKTNDLCVEAICGPETDFNCEFRDITPCANNGICEEGEIETCELSGKVYTPEETITGPALCCPSTTHAVMSKTIESSDCPKNCDDGNDNTADYYNFTAQKCEHYACGGVTITGNTYDFNNVFVTIKLYNVEDKGIGEYISIKNNRDDVVIIGTGCNYPISPYADGCVGWSLRPYDDYPIFNHKYVEQNSEVNGWVWGINVDFLEPYNTSLIKLTISIDGEEISFVKNIEYIEDFEETANIIDENVNYKFDDYYSYQKYVAEELEAETGVEDIGKYGSDVSTRFDGSVYFLMSKSDSWGETYRFWAVQVNAETGELIEYKEIANDGCSGQSGKCPNTDELWWTPEN